jgi:hypothetical protein
MTLNALMAFGLPETVRPNKPKQSEASKNIPFLAFRGVKWQKTIRNDPK